jgi:hypothetical protein
MFAHDAQASHISFSSPFFGTCMELYLSLLASISQQYERSKRSDYFGGRLDEHNLETVLLVL